MAKVTVYLDDDVWSKFRASVFEKHGSLKVLSKQVELSLKQTLQDNDVLTYLARLRGTRGLKTRVRPRLRDLQLLRAAKKQRIEGFDPEHDEKKLLSP